MHRNWFRPVVPADLVPAVPAGTFGFGSGSSGRNRNFFLFILEKLRKSSGLMNGRDEYSVYNALNDAQGA